MNAPFYNQADGQWYQQVPPPGSNPQLMPWNQPQPQQGGGDMNSQLIGALIPLLTTLPSLTNAATASAALAVKLAAIVPPADLVANPSAGDINTLKTYTAKIQAALQEVVGTDTTTFAALRQQAMFSVIIPMMTGGGGGNNAMLPIVLMMALGVF